MPRTTWWSGSGAAESYGLLADLVRVANAIGSASRRATPRRLERVLDVIEAR